MKKILVALLLCITVLSMAFLSSCQYIPEELLDFVGLGDKPDLGKEPENADELYDRMSFVSGEAKSYELELSMAMELYVSSVKFTGSSTGKTIFALQDEENPYYFSEVRQSIKAPDAGYSDSTYELNAYYNGNAFIKREASSHAYQAISSAMKASDYISEIAKNDFDITDDDMCDAEIKTFEKLEDGTWSLKFSEYSERSLTALTEKLGFDDLETDAGISDVHLTILADKDYFPTEMTIEFIFDDYATELDFVGRFYNYDNVVIETDKLDLNKFKRIDNVFLPDKLDDMFGIIEDAEDGYFIADIKTSLSTNGNTSTAEEEFKVKYGEGDNGYYYDIDYTIGTSSINLTYENGLANSGGQSYSMTEREARESVNSVINIALYDKYQVTGLSVLPDGRYEVRLDEVENSAYVSLVRKLMPESYYLNSIDSVNQVIYFYVLGNDIHNLESTVTIRGHQVGGYSYSITITTEIDFMAEPTNDFGTAI